jgi:2,4-didehydro-3-deoxy-L-rhamnonate hydrolase
MRLYTISHNNKTCVAFERDNQLHVVESPDMLTYIRGKGRGATGKALDFTEIKVLAPIRPEKIFCSGLNYHTHMKENPNAQLLDDPRYFAKLPNTIIGPGEPILSPGDHYQIDYEVELAVVFGENNSIFGYTILHDVSSRYIQFKDNNEMMGKNFDSFCPLGPCIVTSDEIPEPEKLTLKNYVNGKLLQNGTNEDWIFPLSHLIAWLAQGITLKPGDILSTGTPMGIGYFRNPQIFLKPGDVCRLEIEKIGVLENPVKAR